MYVSDVSEIDSTIQCRFAHRSPTCGLFSTKRIFVSLPQTLYDVVEVCRHFVDLDQDNRSGVFLYPES